MGKGRLRIGVIGCGGIAQMMHLPFLQKNADRFEITALCDLSNKVLSALARRYHLPDTGCFTDYQLMLKQNLDAVLVTSGGDHT
ncbi:MAG TPA: Gfo/Idh/MocA family oxidoreductase, partial [Anaerolineaceae bacterium]|nr:Gfo/Idh/MocA family oxidoreductase [Anaerolineaceae bacterium]